jgi:hypothetical protein
LNALLDARNNSGSSNFASLIFDDRSADNDTVPLSLVVAVEAVYKLKPRTLVGAVVIFNGTQYIKWCNETIAYDPLQVLSSEQMIQMLVDGKKISERFPQFGGMFPKQCKVGESLQYFDPQAQYKNGDMYTKRVPQMRPSKFIFCLCCYVVCERSSCIVNALYVCV